GLSRRHHAGDPALECVRPDYRPLRRRRQHQAEAQAIMNTNSNSYVMSFAVVICVVVSSVLALLATVLKPTQEAAAEFDRQKNVMMAAGLIQKGDPRPVEELKKLYQDRVTEVIVDTRDGTEAKGKTSADLKELNAEAAAENPQHARAFRSIAMAKKD